MRSFFVTLFPTAEKRVAVRGVGRVYFAPSALFLAGKEFAKSLVSWQAEWRILHLGCGNLSSDAAKSRMGKNLLRGAAYTRPTLFPMVGRSNPQAARPLIASIM